jgi:hypothetical protein
MRIKKNPAFYIWHIFLNFFKKIKMENQTSHSSRYRDEEKTGTLKGQQVAAHKEGPVAKAIEKETSKLPSDLFLWTGLGLLATSVILNAFRQKHFGLMIGQFAAPILIMGLYNKTVKQAGHDVLDKKPS